MRWHLAARIRMLAIEATPVFVPALSAHSFDIGSRHLYDAPEVMPVDTEPYDLGLHTFEAIPLLDLGSFNTGTNRRAEHRDVVQALVSRWERPRLGIIAWSQLVFDADFLQTIHDISKRLQTEFVNHNSEAAVVEAALKSYVIGFRR